jgi:hypothetical protein
MRRNVMFEFLIWGFEYWLVALILVLFFEDQNEINDSEVFVSSINERRKKRLSFSPVVQNESVGWNVSIANQTLLYCIAGVNEKQITNKQLTNNNSQTTKPKGDIYEIPSNKSTLTGMCDTLQKCIAHADGDHFTSGLHLYKFLFEQERLETHNSLLLTFSKGEIPWNIRKL